MRPARAAGSRGARRAATPGARAQPSRHSPAGTARDPGHLRVRRQAQTPRQPGPGRTVTAVTGRAAGGDKKQALASMQAGRQAGTLTHARTRVTCRGPESAPGPGDRAWLPCPCGLPQPKSIWPTRKKHVAAAAAAEAAAAQLEQAPTAAVLLVRHIELHGPNSARAANYFRSIHTFFHSWAVPPYKERTIVRG